MSRRAVVAAVAALAAAAAIPSSAAAKDYASTALNIVPSGQAGGLPVPADADRQAKMYDGLTPLFDQVTTADLFRYFKSEALGAPAGSTPEQIPRAGVTITRDEYHVPHITGKTRDDVTFATGWVTADDRGLLLEQARYNSRVAVVDVPGLTALNLIQTLRSFTPSAQTERETAKQTAVLRKAGPAGRQLLHDIDVFIAGINAHYRATKSTSKPFTRNDIYALNALKGQYLGQGGGDEARRSQFLSALQARLGAKKGLSVFNDLRERDDPETPSTVPGRFPYNSVPKTATGNVKIDPGSLDTSSATAARAAQAGQAKASNVLLVSGSRSSLGHPIFVGGPQIGYYYPGLTMEMEIQGPGGVDLRGVTAAPFPGYMLIGRSQDFAWTLTSQSGDIIDQYAETLCRDSKHYVYKGKCRAMGRFDAGKLGAGKDASGKPEAAREIVFRTTVHGPVVGYARSHGRKVAISSKRSSRGKDILDQLFFQRLTWGKVNSPQDFAAAAALTPQTFNAFYADSKHISEFSTGLLPKRPANVDPGQIADGRGNEEWHGYITPAQHPQGIDPKSGLLVNWNNKVARGQNAADSEWNYGSAQRVLMLQRQLARRSKHDLASVTSAMNAAATQDLRGVLIVPLLVRTLNGSTPPSPLAGQMLALLDRWSRGGASRLDRDLDGGIDDPGAAIIDTAWSGLADAVLKPVLGLQVDDLAQFATRWDAPPEHNMFAGWQNYVSKDLRTLLGDKVLGKYANRYCGAGRLADCQASLWAALQAAGDKLVAAQGADPNAWRADANAERLKFAPGLLTTTIRYANRPSGIQQVISFSGHR
jgi:acyl-homoserine lactone acylase PvdQ